MRLFLLSAFWLACLAFVPPAAVRADTPADPLQLIPKQADLVVKVEQPRRVLEGLTQLELLKQLQAFANVREFLDSTTYRRFYQFVAYMEKQLGAPWPELAERLAGGGIGLGVKLGPNPAPSLLVIQSKDEELLKKAMALGVEVIEQELAREESKEKVEKGTYSDVPTLRIGKDFHVARVGSALLLANKEEALRAGIDTHRDATNSAAKVAGIAEARKLLPPDPLAWAWFNLDTVRQAPQAKEVFTLPRNDANLTVLFGGLLDLAGRSPFVCAGLYGDKKGAQLTVRLPRGREGSTEAMAAHIPPAGQPASLPLLEPKGVLYSTSYYFDVSKFWEHRDKLFNDKQRKAFEDFDATSARFLAGSQFSKLVAEAGAHQRFVAVQPDKLGYKTVPGIRIPAFALVVDMRQPEKFGKSMEAILRGAAFLAGTQVSLKLTEEQHGDVKIIGYRFPEDGQFKGDTQNIRFNFSPCFATVGDQWLACSTLELAHEMVDLLQKEAKAPKQGSPSATRSKTYSAGVADLLHSIQDQLLAQTILDQALPPKEAKEQVKAFIDLVRRLGVLEDEVHYGAKDFRFDFRLTLGK
jgi:hypothetical protein